MRASVRVVAARPCVQTQQQPPKEGSLFTNQGQLVGRPGAAFYRAPSPYAAHRSMCARRQGEAACARSADLVRGRRGKCATHTPAASRSFRGSLRGKGHAWHAFFLLDVPSSALTLTSERARDLRLLLIRSDLPRFVFAFPPSPGISRTIETRPFVQSFALFQSMRPRSIGRKFEARATPCTEMRSKGKTPPGVLPNHVGTAMATQRASAASRSRSCRSPRFRGGAP